MAVKSLTEFNEINRKFILVKKSQIEAILEENKSIFSKYYRGFKLKDLVSFILLFCLTVITVVVGPKVYKNNQEKIVFQPPYGLVMTIKSPSVLPDVSITKNAPFASITGSMFNYTPVRKDIKKAAMPLPEIQVISQQKSQASQSQSQKVTFNAPKVSPLSKTGTSPSLSKAAPRQKLQVTTVAISHPVSSVVTDLNNNSSYRECANMSVNIVETQTENGVKTEANMLNSVATYHDLDLAQKNFAKKLGKHTNSISPQVLYAEKEHVNNIVTRTGLTIPRGQGACYLYPRTHHTLHTKKMFYLVPGDCGYTAEKKGLLYLQDSIQDAYLVVTDNMYANNPEPDYLLPGNIKPVDDLSKYGITPDQVKVAIVKGFALERDTIAKMGIPEEVLLPWSDTNIMNKKQAEAFTEFVRRGELGQGSSCLLKDPVRAAEILETALENGKSVNEHFFAVNQALKSHSPESIIAERHHKAHLAAAAEAIISLEGSGTDIKINSQLKNEYFRTNLSPITLSDAERIAQKDFNLKDLKNGCRSVFPRYSNPNYSSLKNGKG